MDTRSTLRHPLDICRAAGVLLLIFASLWLSGCASPHVALGTHARAKPERVFHLRVVSRKPNQMATALAVELANRGHLVQRFDSQSDADAIRASEHEQNPQTISPWIELVVDGSEQDTERPETVSVRFYKGQSRILAGGINWQNGFAGGAGFSMERIFKWGVVLSAHQITNHIERSLKDL
jgi:hypothetical protein